MKISLAISLALAAFAAAAPQSQPEPTETPAPGTCALVSEPCYDSADCCSNYCGPRIAIWPPVPGKCEEAPETNPTPDPEPGSDPTPPEGEDGGEPTWSTWVPAATGSD